MEETIIKVRKLSKRYSLGKAVKGDLRATISNFFSGKKKNTTDNDFWALKDISFEVKRGEVLGIIGGNGAGKSTLLKILSRITVPTTGSVEITGRVASLLEVGTGFHPELTGRENIFLNGSLLGMRKKEIIAKFDEIVEFSGVEKFIDTPVKHYSSGMYVRLAFSVAAHLEPEILIVDEVLSVGDAVFRAKSMGKMEAIAQGGRTIVFVSHNLSVISSLCTRVLFIENGNIKENTSPKKAISTYLSEYKNKLYFQSNYFQIRFYNQSQSFLYNDPIKFLIENTGIKKDIIISLVLNNYQQQRIFISEQKWSPSVAKWRLKIAGDFLMEGQYFLEVNLKEAVSSRIIEKNKNVLSFKIINRLPELEKYKVENLGIVKAPVTWSEE